MSYRCPQCASGYSKKISLMYSAETRRWSGYRRGGTSQTDLAAMYSPPQSRSSFGRKVLVGILCYLMLAMGGIVSRAFSSRAVATPTLQVAQNPQPVVAHLFRKGRKARHELAAAQALTAPVEVAPAPQTPESKRDLLFQMTGVFAIGGSLIVVLLWSIRRTNHYNRTVWEPASQLWHSSFICKACGEVFVPA
jgi:hypothetical protein